ncbi:hypothetical protein N7517_009967 [Penicillium concentricum]|uniref:Uncharacterized protein n=1 Tax=Penicillium concentricum TaxID=293559 RepID=A0A9W9UZP1_9EURO|nr:uncharacterized protein N7517_009967 [Penicillium concentricum]KAJ5360776.1 hypothetical protein N7517_009967 [Penicillium concentricum]
MKDAPGHNVVFFDPIRQLYAEIDSSKEQGHRALIFRTSQSWGYDDDAADPTNDAPAEAKATDSNANTQNDGTAEPTEDVNADMDTPKPTPRLRQARPAKPASTLFMNTHCDKKRHEPGRSCCSRSGGGLHQWTTVASPTYTLHELHTVSALGGHYE